MEVELKYLDWNEYKLWESAQNHVGKATMEIDPSELHDILSSLAAIRRDNVAKSFAVKELMGKGEAE